MITEYGIEAKSNSEIISELGGRFKEYRLFSNLTQKEVAEVVAKFKEYAESVGISDYWTKKIEGVLREDFFRVTCKNVWI